MTKMWPDHAGSGSVFYEVSGYHERYNRGSLATNGVLDDNAMRRLRFYGIEQAVQAVANVPGDACEIGCYRGLSAWLAADGFRRQGKKLTFHLCDSFEGLSQFGDKDRGGRIMDELRARTKFACAEEVVRRNLSEFDFIVTHKGWVPEPFADLKDMRFCYVHIDVDLHDPTRDSLGFIWPRLNQHGVVLLDDYGTLSFPGARIAVDEFFKDLTDYVLYEQPAGQAIGIKL